MRQAAQESLAAQQQLGREPEIAPGQAFERMQRDPRPFDQFAHRRHFGIENRGVNLGNLRRAGYGQIDHRHEMLVDPRGFGGWIVPTVENLVD